MSLYAGHKALETERLARELALCVLRAPSQAAQVALPEKPGDAADWERRKILPPYLGEMGVEIRYLLAAVEPWLNNGWRIPARRPELYPPGTAFADPALFADLGAVLEQAGARPHGAALFIPGAAFHGFQVDGSYDPQSGLAVQLRNPDPGRIGLALRIAELEQALRRIFARHHMPHSRPVTPWDRALTTIFDGRPEHHCGGAIVLAPSYLPEPFVQPGYDTWPHVGVQLRHVVYNPTRNSDAAKVMAAATAAAAHLDVPLLVYGHPGGTLRPDGYESTYALHGADLLRFELAMLRDCRVMFAPDSGWCDLMCWLRVPTLVEMQQRPSTFAGMRAFRPRLAQYDAARPVAEQVDALLRAEEQLPAAVRDARVFDDLDWDGAWIGRQAREFVNL